MPLVVVRHSQFDLDYSAAILYGLGLFLIWKFGDVYSVRTHDPLWTEDMTQVPFHDG